MRTEFAASEMRSREDRTAKIDVFWFALIWFGVLVGFPALGRTNTSKELGKLPARMCEWVDIPGFVPKFVPVLIGSGLSSNRRKRPSFDDIFEAVKENSGVSHAFISISRTVDLNWMILKQFSQATSCTRPDVNISGEPFHPLPKNWN
jgi:hypothetical protein